MNPSQRSRGGPLQARPIEPGTVSEYPTASLKSVMSDRAPACVKTRASRECAALFSPFYSFACDCQCCSFPTQRNRYKSSTRKFDVGVFTQAGSKTDFAGTS